MSFKLPEDIIPCYEEDKAKKFVEDLWGCAPTFICTIGNTETAKIPGISAAGAGPASMDYTPAADVELLFFGKCKCIDSVPVTPDGVPTPGLITMSAMKAANIPFFVLNGGVKVRPHAPYFDVEGQPGEDIRTGRAVKNAERSYDRAVLAGKNLAKLSDYLVVGESISGGTTTAMAVLTAMGVDAAGKLLNDQVGERGSLRQKIVEEGIRASGLSRETLKRDPMAAVEAVGDRYDRGGGRSHCRSCRFSARDNGRRCSDGRRAFRRQWNGPICRGQSSNRDHKMGLQGPDL